MKQEALRTLLYRQFPEYDARLLDYFFDRHAAGTTLSYEEIDLARAEKNDLILLGYQQRLLIPLKTSAGPAWEERNIDFGAYSTYMIAPVVRQIPVVFSKKGFICLETLLNLIFADWGAEEVKKLSHLLDIIMTHSTGFKFETGLLKLFYDQLTLKFDLHHTIDLFVINGIMSPCPRKSIMTGLSWYEISPALFWG
ncbi:MAG: hypothetical protein SWH54_19120 [Thermodesulfobacteriota bacterium]|nr:hypothetical protein [Thermodesulfobacteriota bacterium]